MSLLLPASTLTGHPVVTLGGDDVGEVKDVVLGLDEHALVGFTLRKRTRLGGPLRQRLPWENVRAIGDSAVMIDHVAALVEHPLVDDSAVDEVLDIDVLTDTGDRLGRLTDVIVQTGQPATVVGFEIAAHPPGQRQPQRQFIPIGEMVAVSNRALVVPARARDFVANDLTGFGTGVAGYREQLRGGSRAAQ